MSRRESICFILFFWMFGSALAEDRVVTLVADEWCPFNCRALHQSNGILVDRAEAALAEKGLQTDYIEIPWSRAIVSVRNGVYDGIVGAGPSEVPDFHFPPLPLAIGRHSFFTMPSQSWEYRGLSSLEEVRIGVIQDYSYGGLYEDYIRANQDDSARVVTLKGGKVLPRLIKMLELGRIDALAAEEHVLNYYFQSRGLQTPLRHAGLAYEEPLYVSFSPAVDDGAELANALAQGFVAASDVP